MFRATIEGVVETSFEKEKKDRDGNLKKVRVIQVKQPTPNGASSFVFIQTENGLKAEVGKSLSVLCLVIPYARRDGTAEVTLKAIEK